MAETLEQQYQEQLERLKKELVNQIPSNCSSREEALAFLEHGDLDEQLIQYVVLMEATPKYLAAFAASRDDGPALVHELFSNKELLREMLYNDSAAIEHFGHASSTKDHKYGQAMAIYNEIQEVRTSRDHPVLDRLAVAIALVHAAPIKQDNPKAAPEDAPKIVDPVARYLNYEMAFLDGELDGAFQNLTTWELRFVVDGEEPDETAAWGRRMLRAFRPDHLLTNNMAWRYVNLVRTDIRYGSKDVKYDRPELQQYQNILMNGGVCGRRSFIGRFILRAFGIPTAARPSRGHGALCHYTPDHGWVVNLGPNWGGTGWTKTRYWSDEDFRDTAQARKNPEAYWKVKRAQWIGDVMGEVRVYGPRQQKNMDKLGFWYGVSHAALKSTLEAEVCPVKDRPSTLLTLAQRILASPANRQDKQIAYQGDGGILIPSAAFITQRPKNVQIMQSFRGGYQVYMSRFAPQGLTVLRGGTWKAPAKACRR